MGTSNKIRITNPILFADTLSILGKYTQSAKFEVGENNTMVNVIIDKIGKVCMATDTMQCDTPCSFCFKDISVFTKLVNQIVKRKKSESGVELSFDGEYISIASKQLSSDLITTSEIAIHDVIAPPPQPNPEPILEFRATTDSIKDVIANQYVFTNPGEVLIKFSRGEGSDKNSVFASAYVATQTGRTAGKSNKVSTRIGDLTLGNTDESQVVIDYNRLQLFSYIHSDDILMQYFIREVNTASGPRRIPTLTTTLVMTESKSGLGGSSTFHVYIKPRNG